MEHHIIDALKFNTYIVGNPDVILENYDENEDEFSENNLLSDNEDTFYPRMKEEFHGIWFGTQSCELVTTEVCIE